jgi:signal transduction histidine kinase
MNTYSHLANSTVLIVDDVAENLEVLGSKLQAASVNVLAAQSGESALKIATAKRPDLILLDVQMPMMDGYTVKEHLGENPVTADIPVIFLTARTDVNDVVRGFELGAADYITKPVQTPELIARVRHHLELRSLRLQQEQRERDLEREIGERLMAEEALRKANEHLEDLNAQKNEFIGIAVHDLKNPLSGISALAQTVKELPNIEREEVEEYMKKIIASANRMFDLIKSFLNVNAIEQGGVQISLTPVNISLVTRMATQSYLLKAQAKSIALHINTGEDIHGVADESILVQVLDNLVSNALKFSPMQRSIYVRVKECNNCIKIEVQDEGPGLSNDDKKKLFGKFARLSARPAAGESSTGLGLSIVKTMVEAMNGIISCESEFGNGATFSLELPLVTD